MTAPEPRDHEEHLPDLMDVWAETDGRSPKGPCADANLLAAFAEGRSLPEERAELEVHLLTCKACREAVGAVVRAEPAPEPTRDVVMSPQPRRLAPWVAAAAAALLLAMLGTALWDQGGHRPSTDAQLAAALSDLRRAHPALFDDVVPLAHAERIVPGRVSERGGLVLLAPIELIVGPSPTFEWRVPGNALADIVVSTAAGRKVWQAAAVSSPWRWPSDAPPLEQGSTYMWEIEIEGALGPERGTRTFTRARADLTLRFERQVEVVERDMPAAIRELLLAHVALRAGLLLKARAHARAWRDAHPDDPVGAETLYQVLTRLGDPDAGLFLEKL